MRASGNPNLIRKPSAAPARIEHFDRIAKEGGRSVALNLPGERVGVRAKDFRVGRFHPFWNRLRSRLPHRSSALRHFRLQPPADLGWTQASDHLSIGSKARCRPGEQHAIALAPGPQIRWRLRQVQRRRLRRPHRRARRQHDRSTQSQQTLRRGAFHAEQDRLTDRGHAAPLVRKATPDAGRVPILAAHPALGGDLRLR